MLVRPIVASHRQRPRVRCLHHGRCHRPAIRTIPAAEEFQEGLLFRGATDSNHSQSSGGAERAAAERDRFEKGAVVTDRNDEDEAEVGLGGVGEDLVTGAWKGQVRGLGGGGCVFSSDDCRGRGAHEINKAILHAAGARHPGRSESYVCPNII